MKRTNIFRPTLHISEFNNSPVIYSRFRIIISFSIFRRKISNSQYILTGAVGAVVFKIYDTELRWYPWKTRIDTCIIWILINICRIIQHTWVISKVLHTVCFLFKNEFILQNTFTGLLCNLHCALSQQSNVWESLVFLSGCLRCWCVWLLRSPH
jgi:hypothetical protein